MSPSAFLHMMEEGKKVYKDVWEHKDESGNFPQNYDPEMIKEEKRKELESEIRVQVIPLPALRTGHSHGGGAFSQFPLNGLPRISAVFRCHKENIRHAESLIKGTSCIHLG